MLKARRKFLFGLALLLLVGLTTGWLYERPLLGIFIATAGALAWMIYQFLSLESAIRTGNFERVRLRRNERWAQ